MEAESSIGFEEFFTSIDDDDKYAKNLGILELKGHIATPKTLDINTSENFDINGMMFFLLDCI